MTIAPAVKNRNGVLWDEKKFQESFSKEIKT